MLKLPNTVLGITVRSAGYKEIGVDYLCKDDSNIWGSIYVSTRFSALFDKLIEPKVPDYERKGDILHSNLNYNMIFIFHQVVMIQGIIEVIIRIYDYSMDRME